VTHIRPFKGVMPRLADSVFVDKSAVVIGDVSADEDVSIWPCAVVRGDMHSIKIGARTSVQDNAGTLVPPGKKLESGYMYMGQPCKQVRPLTEKETNFFEYSSTNYVKLKNEYLNEG